MPPRIQIRYIWYSLHKALIHLLYINKRARLLIRLCIEPWKICISSKDWALNIYHINVHMFGTISDIMICCLLLSLTLYWSYIQQLTNMYICVINIYLKFVFKPFFARFVRSTLLLWARVSVHSVTHYIHVECTQRITLDVYTFIFKTCINKFQF